MIKNAKTCITTYEVTITKACNNGIWYANKLGSHFHAVILEKLVAHGEMESVYKLIDYKGQNKDPSIPLSVLTIREDDCLVVNKIKITSNRNIKYLQR
jgi:hypothetical protein